MLANLKSSKIKLTEILVTRNIILTPSVEQVRVKLIDWKIRMCCVLNKNMAGMQVMQVNY